MVSENYRIKIPTLFPAQERAWKLIQRERFVAGRCGRRFGKTDLAKTIVCDDVARGELVGWFAPDYKTSSEAYNEMEEILEPIKKSPSRQGSVLRTRTGGRMDFWTLDNERAGRSRKYHRVVIDEAAFTDNETMMGIWEKSIKPTLLDYGGRALVLSNTNGIDTTNFFWRICNEKSYGFAEFHAPTHDNPFLPAEELAKLKADNHPLVYQQEYLAEFVDWSGVAFFALDKMLLDGRPVPIPKNCDAVFATVDTATKTGSEHDGTAVIYWAYTKRAPSPLVMLDWDIVQIEGALLETWLPTVFQQCEHLARACGARAGSLGAHVEDKASGMVLIQQATRKKWPAHAIDSKLTSLGKSERAINVSGYVYRGQVKLTSLAHDKVTVYKGTSRNHMLGHVLGFRVGDKDQKEDDLLDCYCYGIALSLGGAGGF